MTDRHTNCDGRRAPRLCRRRIAARPARRRRGLARVPSRRCGQGRGLAQPGRAHSRTLRRRRGDEPTPERLELARLARRRRRGLAAMAVAAVLAAFLVGGAVGWVARGAEAAATSSDLTRFTADALEAYRLYAVEVRHPVEVPGEERPHLMQWLSKRLGSPLRAPELDKMGLKLVGGRLLPGPTGASAFFMYEGPSGERFTLYCGHTRIARPRCATRRAIRTQRITGSTATSPTCSAARRSATSCTRSRKPPMIRSTRARRSRAADGV